MHATVESYMEPHWRVTHCQPQRQELGGVLDARVEQSP